MKPSYFSSPRSLEDCVFISSADPFSWDVKNHSLKKMAAKYVSISLSIKEKPLRKKVGDGKGYVGFFG